MLNFLVKFKDGKSEYVTPLCSYRHKDEFIEFYGESIQLGLVRASEVKSILPINLDDRDEGSV